MMSETTIASIGLAVVGVLILLGILTGIVTLLTMMRRRRDAAQPQPRYQNIAPTRTMPPQAAIPNVRNSDEITHPTTPLSHTPPEPRESELTITPEGETAEQRNIRRLISYLKTDDEPDTP